MDIKSKSYSAYQKGLIFLCWAIYTVSYFGRLSFSSNITNIMESYGVTHAEAGLVTTFFFFAYGAGQFVNGLLCKHYNKTVLFPAALTVSAAINVAVFAGLPFNLIKYFWFVNGCSQSVLWSSLILILGENLDRKHADISVAVLGTTTSIGTFLSYFSGFAFTRWGNYKIVFPVAAAVMILMAAMWLVFYPRLIRNINASKPLAPEPSAQQEISGEKPDSQEQRENVSKLAGRSAIVTVAVFAFFSIVCNFLKDGLQTWVPAILKETYHMDDSISILLTLVLPGISAFCGLVTLAVSKVIKSFPLLAAAMFGVSALCALVLRFTLGVSFIAALVFFAIISLLAHCINSVSTNLLPLRVRGSLNPGTVSGILNGSCYVGSTISAYGLGLIADNAGWDTVFSVFLISAAVASLTGLVFFFVENARSRKNSA